MIDALLLIIIKMKISSYFPLVSNKDKYTNQKHIILKGKNKVKVKSDKWPHLSITSHYIGNRANKFGVFTNQCSPRKFNHPSLIDSNFVTLFTNKKLNALINNTPKNIDRFKEIPIKDTVMTSVEKFLQTIWYNGIPTPSNVLHNHRSKFLNFIKERKTLGIPLTKSNSTHNYYAKTFYSMGIMESEVSNGMIGECYNEENSNRESCRINLVRPMNSIKHMKQLSKSIMSCHQNSKERILVKNKNLSQKNMIPFELMNDIALFPKMNNAKNQSQSVSKIKKIKLRNIVIKSRSEEMKMI